MRKIRIVLILAAILSTQQVFADDVMSSDSKSCSAIADACVAGGFARTESAGKKFWNDCMRPILLGKTVSGVTIDAATAKDCRVHKIEELKKELKDFQNVKAK